MVEVVLVEFVRGDVFKTGKFTALEIFAGPARTRLLFIEEAYRGAVKGEVLSLVVF